MRGEIYPHVILLSKIRGESKSPLWVERSLRLAISLLLLLLALRRSPVHLDVHSLRGEGLSPSLLMDNEIPCLRGKERRGSCTACEDGRCWE